MHRFSRSLPLILSALLLFTSGCSFQSDATRTEETRRRMEKLGGAFLVHYAYVEGRARTIQEVVKALIENDPDPLPADVAQKVIDRLSCDAWGRVFSFNYIESSGGLSVRLLSAGSDGIIGTGDDIDLTQTIIPAQTLSE